ncbi:MAG: hypothetical protein GXP05_12570 [Alphaproteobacteria bacterium]|nr:hypothetical protein [Alphaproteobacteria bacterium]
MKTQSASTRPAPLAGTYLKSLLLVLAGSMVIAISAQINVPMFPVPMTLQTLAITLIGLTFGSRLAMLTVLAYGYEYEMGVKSKWTQRYFIQVLTG